MARPEPGDVRGDVRVTVDLPADVYQRLLVSADNIAFARSLPKITLEQLIRAVLREVTSEPYLMTQCTRTVRQELPPPA